MPCSPTSFLVSLSVDDGEAGLLVVAVGLGCCGGGGGGGGGAASVLSRVVDDSVLDVCCGSDGLGAPLCVL